MTARAWGLVAVGSALALAACGGTSTGGAASTAGPGAGAAGDGTVTVTVFAAASLTKVFTDLGAQFESAHPGTDVEFSFAGSSDLVAQLQQGAPGDVFASADEKNMDQAVGDGVVDRAAVHLFASNTLTIVTAAGNPERVTSLKDLERTDVTTVVCAPQVPCGSATKKVQRAAGVTIKAVSEENAVTDVLGKVTSGQADAGLVYVTDAARAGDTVTAVDFPQADKAVNRYPIAVTKQAHDPRAAGQFVELVLGSPGQRALAQVGFRPAP